MAEATEEVTGQVTETPATEAPPVDTPAQEEEVDLTKEPGGDTPEDTYARRRSRELKQTKEELAAARADRIRLEERLRTLEEVRQKDAPKPTVYTAEQIEAFIDEGKITRGLGMQYLARLEAERVHREVEQKREQERPVERAREEINKWLEVMPSLRDDNSDHARKAAQEFANLRAEGEPDNWKTKLLAIRLAHGERTVHEKRREVASLNRTPPRNPSDASGGGTTSSNGKVDTSKADPALQHIWEKTGTDPVARERQTKIYLEQQARKKR